VNDFHGLFRHQISGLEKSFLEAETLTCRLFLIVSGIELPEARPQGNIKNRRWVCPALGRLFVVLIESTQPKNRKSKS
jgi:hypothetical protein